MAVALLGSGVAASSFLLLPPAPALVSCLLGWTMLAIAVVDARQFIVPDVLSLPSIPAGLLASGHLLDAGRDGLVDIDHVIGALTGGLCLWLVRAAYFALRRREGLGLGDVKLAAAAGAWAGWQSLSLVLLLAAASALTFVVALTIMRGGGLTATDKIPFGTFLAPSIWVAWLLDACSRLV